jgi:hypothetical protein
MSWIHSRVQATLTGISDSVLNSLTENSYSVLQDWIQTALLEFGSRKEPQRESASGCSPKPSIILVLGEFFTGLKQLESEPDHSHQVERLRLYGCIPLLPITVPARSKTWTVFTRSNTGIVGSNLTWGMDVCVLLFCVCAVLCAGSGLASGWSKESYRLCKISINWKVANAQQRAVEP